MLPLFAVLLVQPFAAQESAFVDAHVRTALFPLRTVLGVAVSVTVTRGGGGATPPTVTTTEAVTPEGAVTVMVGVPGDSPVTTPALTPASTVSLDFHIRFEGTGTGYPVAFVAVTVKVTLPPTATVGAEGDMCNEAMTAHEGPGGGAESELKRPCDN
jgi:hypothetical protein